MTSEKEYIVYREVQDMGPMGSRSAYVKIQHPNPGEKIFHGQFRRMLVSSGQFDGSTIVEYQPVGSITSEVYGEVETF